MRGAAPRLDNKAPMKGPRRDANSTEGVGKGAAADRVFRILDPAQKLIMSLAEGQSVIRRARGGRRVAPISTVCWRSRTP